MATRCNIIIKQGGSTICPKYIYHHNDGCPAGVGKDLEKQLEKYMQNDKSLFTIDDVAKSICSIDNSYETVYNTSGDIEYLYIVTILFGNELGLKCYKTNKITPFSLNDFEEVYNKVLTKGKNPPLKEKLCFDVDELLIHLRRWKQFYEKIGFPIDQNSTETEKEIHYKNKGAVEYITILINQLKNLDNENIPNNNYNIL